MKLIPIALACILLTGCATDNYRLYAQAQKAIADAETAKETARYQALAEIAKQGDTAAKVAAVITLNSMGGSGNQRPATQIAAPETFGDVTLKWLSVLMPAATQFYTVNRSSAVAMRQSDNATALGINQSNNQANVTINTNGTFANLANSGFNAATAIANTGFGTTANVANSGTAALVNVANTGSNNLTTLGTAFGNATVNMTNAHANAVINLSNTIPNLQPNITTTTTNNNAP